jgi:hypothetical protein
VTAALRLPVIEPGRPTTRGQCGEQRPCPFVGCRQNLFLASVGDGSRPERQTMRVSGAARMPADRWHPWLWSDSEIATSLESLRESCALDVTRDFPDGITLEEIGALLGITREAARLVERSALRKLAANAAVRRLGRDG